MPYYDAILTSNVSVDAFNGPLLLLSSNRVLLLGSQEGYMLLGYYTHSGDLVWTTPQSISEDVLTQIFPIVMSELELDLEPDPGPQGPDDQMLELPEALVVQGPEAQEPQVPEALVVQVPEAPDPQGPYVPVPEPEGLYRFRNIHLRL